MDSVNHCAVLRKHNGFFCIFDIEPERDNRISEIDADNKTISGIYRIDSYKNQCKTESGKSMQKRQKFFLKYSCRKLANLV